MATYDDTINKHKKNLRDAQIEALVEKAKQFSRENASVRSDAVRDAVEGYDTAYRNLQNLGLAGRQGTEMTGEVPRLKKKIEGEFNQTNARLIGNENNALDSIGASMAEQNKVRRVPPQQTIVPTQTTNSMLQRMLPTIKPGEDVSITGNVQGIQRMRVGQVALGDNPDNVNQRLAYNEAYKQYNRSVLERNAYNKSVENPVGEARLEGEAQKARAAMVALGIQPKSVNNRGEITSGILQQERQTDNAIRYEQYQDTMTQVKYGKDTATKRRALDSVAQQMVDTSTSFDVRYAMAVDYLQNSKITSKEADLAASRVIAEAYGVGYYSDEEIAYLEKKKKEAETVYVESGDGRTLDNAKNDLQEAKKVRNEFDAVANTLVRKVKGAKETPATIKAKKEAQEKYTKAKEGFDKARASKDSRAGSGVRKYADDMKALLSDDTIGLETRYEMAVDIVRTIDEGDAPELYAEAERIFGMYYGLPEQMSDANYNNLYNMYKMAGRKNPFGINNTEEKKAWERAQTDRAQYEHYIAGLVNKEKYVGKKPTQPINEKEGNAYYAAVNGYLFDGFEDSQARIAEEKRYGRYKYMNQEERDAYNYLYETEGIDAANDFAKSLDGILDARRSAGLAKTAEDDAERGVFSNIASNALSVLVGLGEIQPAVERLGQGIYNELVGTGAPAYIDSNSSSYDVSNARSAIRSKTSELILGDNPTVWREVANFAYNTTMSMADSATMMPIHAAGLGWVTDLVFFSSASNDAYKDAVSRGATQSQAMGAAVLSGVAEALFEHVSLDQAIHMLKTGNLKYLRNILRQGFVEGSEEFFTELANTLTDKMFMQELSKNSLNRKKYISDGMSEKEADMQVFLDTLSNLGLATLGGFVSGGIFGTFGTVANRINNKNVGTSLQNNGAGNAIAENAKRIGGDAAILADEYTSKGKPLTAEQTGEIYNAMAEQIQESVKSEEDLSTLATIMDGKTVTDTQAEAMLGSSKELLDNAGFDTSSAEALKESFEQRNKEVTDFGNKARQDFYNDVSRKSVASVYRSTDIQDQAPALPTGMSGVALAEAQKQNFKAQSIIKSGRVELQLSMLKTNGGVSTTAQLNQVKSAMTKEAQRKLTAIERLSEALNMDVVVHDVMTGTNGFFGEDGKIHFTLSSKLSVPRVAAHELTHKMKTDARAQYDAVRDQIIQNAGQEEFDDLMAEKAKEYGFDLKNESQRELCDDEVVAELCEGMLSDSKKLSSFAERHLEAAKALKARLTKIIVAIKNALMGTEQFSDEMFVDQDVIDKWLEGLNAVIAQAEARQETLEGIIATEAGVTSEQQESLMRDVAEIHAEAQQKINETKAELQEKIAELEGEKSKEEQKEAADKKIGEAITQHSVDIIAYDLPGYKADLTAAGVMTAKSIDSLFKLMNKVIDKIRLDEKSRRILDFGTELTTEEEIQLAKETRAYSPYKSNADPHYKLALDFSTLCRKRILLQAIQERLQTKLRRSLEQEEIVAIRLELQKLQAEGMKIEVACALCYVEAARLKSPKVINEFLADPEKHMRNYMAQTNKSAKAEIKALQEQWKVDHGYEAKATKKVMSEVDKKEYNKHFKELRQQYQQDAETEKIIADAVQAIRKTPASVLTASGLANLKKSVDSADNALYNAFIRKVTAATRSKAQETDVPYVRGDVLQVAQSLIDQMNEESGFRHQSWSDFQIIHLLDTMASIIELSQRKAKMHAYTKVPMFVELVGRTGMMINMSLIPAGDIGIDADGHLIFDPVGGMAFEDMLRLRDMFPNTAGNVAIGIDDRQIQIMLESDQIDYVIPYHVSGLNKKMRKYMDIQAWHEYTSSQNEKGNKRGKKGKAPALKEWFDEAEGVKAKDGYEYMRQASEKYLRLCYERNLTPKFPQYLNKNSDGSYSLKAEYANYWKLLIDRKMVNHKTGKIIAQKAVLPIFDSDFILGNDAKGITGILDQALADPAVQDVVTAENMVYEKFSNWDRDINNADAEAIAEAKRMRDLTAQVAVQKTVEAGKVKTRQINSVDNQTADIDSRFSIDHDLLRELDAYNAHARLEGEIDVAMQAAKQVGKLETRLNKSLENQKKLRAEFNERLKTEKKTMKESFKAEKKKAVSDAELAGEIHVARQAAKQVGNLERKLQKSKEEIVGLKKKPKEAVAKERKRVAQNTAKKVIKRQIRTMDRIYAHPKAGMYVAQEFLSDVKDFLIEMEMYTSGSEGSLKRIAKVEKAYEDLRPTNPNEMSDTAVRYDESVMRALKEVKEIMSVKNFKELTLEELLTVMNAVSGVSVSIKNAIEFVDRTKDMNIGDRADRLQNQALDNSKRFKWYKKHGSSLAIKALKSILSPERYARFVSGYASDSVLTEEMQYLNNGQNRVTEIQRDALRPYEAFMNEHGKEFVKWQGKDATWVDTGMADVDGNPVQITPAMRIALVLQTRNKQNMKHLLEGGFRMPNVNMYKNGKFSNMYDTGVRVIPTQEQLLALENGMSATEKLYMDLVAETFNEYLPSIINETSVKMVGFKLARVKNYFPIIVDSSYLNTNYGAAFARGDLQDSGWLQERKNSSKPVMLEDVNQTLERQIEGVSMYGGLAIPIANFERLINTGNFRIATVNGEETLIEHPVKDTLRQDIPYGMDFVRKLIEDLKGGSSNPRMVSQLFSKIQSAYIKSVLALNTTSFASQLSSYPATAAVVGWNNAAKALTSGKVDYDTIYKYSEVAWDRARGYSSPELKDYTESSKNWRLKYPKLTKAVWGWMNQGDKITVGLQWKAAEFWVQEHTDLKQGTEAYYVAVGKKLNEIVQTVQENSSVMQRGEILRNKKIGYQPFTLFKTQQFQIGGMVADSALELAIRDRSNMSQAEIKEMVDRCATRISLSLVLAASSSIARFLGNLVRGTLNGYRDDDDELTGESILLNMLDEFADGIVGMFPFAEEVKTLIVNNVILKEPRYDMNDVTTDVLNTFADLVTNLPKYLEKAFNPDLSSEERFANFKKAAKKIGSVIGQVTGIPVDNAWKILQGYHNMGNDAIDAIRYGSIDWFRHSSGQLDNKRTHTEYNTARKAGISGNDFFSWKKTLKGEASEKRKMLFDGEKDPKKAAVLDSLLIPSDSSTEQKVEGAVVLTRSIDKDGTPKKYSDGTEAQWVVKADYSNDDMFNISQYGDAKYTKAKEAMSNGAKSTNILGLYDAMAEYSEVNGTQMNAEEKRAWIRTNVKDTKQSAVLDAYIVCKTDSTNVRVIGNGHIVQTMKMENGEPKTYADGHVATWEIAADYSSDDMFKLSQRGESYYAKGVNALQNGADIKTVNRLLEANDAYMEANGNGMNTEEKRNWIYDNVENRSQAAVLDAYMVSNGNEVKVEGNIVSALFGNGEWNVVSDYSSETWYKLSQYGNDGNDTRYQKALTVSRKGGDATKVLKYYEYCDSQRDTPSYEERRDWIYKCGASASERAIMDAYLTRQDKDTEVMTKGGIVYTRSLGSNGKPKTYADGSKATWKVASDYTSKDWYEVSKTGYYDKARKAYESVGIRPSTFSTIYEAWSALSAKDANGRTVNGLKKRRTIEYLNTTNLTREQKQYFLTQVCGYK